MVFRSHYRVQAVFKETLLPITVVGCRISSVESSSGFLTVGCVRLESKRSSWAGLVACRVAEDAEELPNSTKIRNFP